MNSIRIRVLFDANNQSREAFGRPETYVARLMHAKLYGVDTPFQKRTYAGRSVRAFREPLRFWARDEAVGTAIPIEYEFSADELSMPVKGNLVIYIERPVLKSV